MAKAATKKTAGSKVAAKRAGATKRAAKKAATKKVATRKPKAASAKALPRVGAHVSAAGSVDKAVANALKIEAEAIQIFGAAPQSWRRKQHDDESVAAFRRGVAEAGIGPNFIHGIYLTNLASQDQGNMEKGIESLTAEMRLASRLGIAGVIFHVGSHKGIGFEEVLPQVVDAMQQVLDGSPDDVALCIENSAGAGDSVGSTWDEIGAIIDGVGSDQVKVCLDTCHAFSSGYDLRDPEALDQLMTEFDQEIGTERLVAVHANDSKTELRSGRDRHENIGAGTIGKQGFLNVLAHPAFNQAPFLLEVPGFEDEGPDAKNVAILKRLRDKA